MFASKDSLLTRPSGYNIARSVRLRSSATGYLSRTPSSTTNRRTWTWSGWMKRGTDKYSLLFAAGNVTDIWNTGTNCTLIGYWINTNQLVVYDNGTVFRQTQQVFRDFSAWYHIVVAFDTTQATAANRLRVYINGAEVTSWDTNAAPTQNLDMAVNVNQNHFVGGQSTNVANAYFDGYLTEINFVDGQQLTPSSFGETDSITGVWKPKAYSGTYGTNGFYLNFSDNSNNTAATIGKDYSGNGNNWTPNNISVTAGATYDSMQDVPTLTSATAANYAVLNPLNVSNSPSVADGNLQVSTSASALWKNVQATIGASSGKFYWESTISGGSLYYAVGVAISTKVTSTYDTGEYGIWMYDGRGYKIGEGGSNSTAYGATYTSGDVIGVALDSTSGTITFYKNGTSQGVAFSTGLAGVTVLPQFGVYYNGSANTQIANFGQRPFSYTPPSGYVALNTYNLPASTITNGAAYMAATTYTGNGGTAQTITNTNGTTSFQPDFVWIKSRNSASFSHRLYDSVRGVGKELYSNATNSESTVAQSLTAFASNGFTLGTDLNNNQSSITYIGWQWKAGGTSASNTNGSITSTVSAGATQGFSVVTYTGTGANATVGHGLGVAPSMIIVKKRSGANAWFVGATPAGWNKYLLLNLTDASATDPGTVWQATAPTSSVFYLGTTGEVNANTATFVAYCFAAVAGYSAFGSYTGNGSTDGPFIYTGFRPRWLMTKRTDSSTSGDWNLVDTSRGTYNAVGPYLYANLSNAEGNAAIYDILSNGFKIRETGAGTNASGSTYIYAAFAENAFKNALAR